jgi:predicted DNA-binding antitoxin AbrB/MazE fold protein
MTQITEAIFSDGVLRPVGGLTLREHERVRLIIQSIDQPSDAERAKAVELLRSGIRKMGFKSNGAYPSRDELHERG